MGANLPTAAEQPHPASGDPGWVEVWDNWFVVPGEPVGGYVRLTHHPHEAVTWYWAGLLGFGRGLVTVLVDDLPEPTGSSLELRAPGIWTETVVLQPLEHLTTDLEAFGVEVESPTDVWSGAWGKRTAVGLELDWDSAGEPGPSPVAGTDGYRLVGQMHGEVLIDERRFEIEGIGVRDHWWGVPEPHPAWRAWASEDGSLIHSDSAVLDVDLSHLVDDLPVGEVGGGVRVLGWAPAVGGGRRYARALVSGVSGPGWLEIVR